MTIEVDVHRADEPPEVKTTENRHQESIRSRMNMEDSDVIMIIDDEEDTLRAKATVSRHTELPSICEEAKMIQTLSAQIPRRLSANRGFEIRE